MELYCDYIATPRGIFTVLFNDSGIYRILFPGSAPEERSRERRLPFTKLPEDFNRYLAGEVVDWSNYLLDRSGYAPFTGKVLEKVSEIPYGTVSTYREVAKKAGSPVAWRAAGQALGANRHPIMVPCHRVIKSDMSLGGFSGPAGWKRELLFLEGAFRLI